MENKTKKKSKPILGKKILVEDIESKSPFSKARLARSLVAAGINHIDADKIADKIEKKILKKDISLLKRNQIREMVSKELEKKLDPKYRNQYDLWQKFTESDLPLIILIGGPTGAGKSTVSMRLANRLNIRSVIGTDIIRSVMRYSESSEENPNLFLSSYQAHRSGRETLSFKDRVISGFVKQTKAISSAIEYVINRNIVENKSTIIEGVHLVPGFLTLPKNAIIFTCILDLKNEDDHKLRFINRGIGNRYRNPQKYLNSIDAIRHIRGFVYEQAKIESIFTIDSNTPEDCVNIICDKVFSKIKDKFRRVD